MDRLTLLTYREVAAHYRVSERTVRHWAQKGAVEIIRTPGGSPRVVLPSEGAVEVAICGNPDDDRIAKPESGADT